MPCWVKPLIEVKARENQRGGQGGVLLSQNSVEASTRTDSTVAELAGVSRDTVRKVEKIQQQAGPALHCGGRVFLCPVG